MPERTQLHVYRWMPWAAFALRAGFAIHSQARRTQTPNRVHGCLGLFLRRRLFPTPPRGDAVSFRFTTGTRFGGVQICTDWIICIHDHTGFRLGRTTYAQCPRIPDFSAELKTAYVR
jgi:hypothetical protein